MMNESTLELDELKKEAIEKGVNFHPGIGLAKLKARLETAESRKNKPDASSEEVEEKEITLEEEVIETNEFDDAGSDALKVYKNKTTNNLFTQYGKVIPNGLVKLTSEELEPYKDKNKDLDEIDGLVYVAASRARQLKDKIEKLVKEIDKEL